MYENKNEEYFTNITKYNSYWAGFIAADGYVNEDRNTLSISLSSKDAKHLERISKELNPDYKLVYANNRFDPSSKITEVVKFSITSKLIVSDLKKHWKIHQRKTFSLEFPAGLSIEEKKAFIVGYIDGDGCIAISENNNKIYLRISGNKLFLTQLCRFFIGEGLVEEENIYTDKTIYVMVYGGRTAMRILNFLYDPDIPVMHRKWANYQIATSFRFRDYNLWNDSDVALIEKLYGERSLREIWKSHYCDRTYESLEKFVSRKKILKPGRVRQKRWTEKENEQFLIAIKNGLTIRDIRDKIFPYRTCSSVKNQKRKLLNKENR